jgi:hypothetical protein
MKKTMMVMAGVALFGLGACVSVAPPTGPSAAAPVVEQMTTEAARAAAKTVVTPIVAAQVPGPTGVALANCIIENASSEELFTLARATGADAATVNLTSAILSRPETVACATSSIST